MKFNIAILLTWMRIFIVPFFVAIYYLPNSIVSAEHQNIIATSLFLFAAITDYFDGYFARKLNQVSTFGAFLDPVADKAIVVTSLVILVSLQRTFLFAAIIIILREIAISALREWMAQIGNSQNLAVAYIGKIKTAMQLISIALLLLDWHTNVLGNICMLFAVLFTIISMFYYLKQAKDFVKKRNI